MWNKFVRSGVHRMGDPVQGGMLVQIDVSAPLA